MKRQDLFQLAAYIGVSVAAVGAAFLISVKFLGVSSAQEETAPPAVEGGAPPAAPAEAVPPAAQEAPQAEAPAIDSAQQQAMDQAAMAQNSGIAELEGFLEPFIYDIVNRRDPFQIYADYIPADESGGQRTLSPAQRFDLDQLKLVGVMWGVKDPKAMFVDPSKEVLVLGRDESIGNKNGYIAAIREGEVVVVEAIRKRGDIIYRTRVLRIER